MCLLCYTPPYHQQTQTCCKNFDADRNMSSEQHDVIFVRFYSNQMQSTWMDTHKIICIKAYWPNLCCGQIFGFCKHELLFCFILLWIFWAKLFYWSWKSLNLLDYHCKTQAMNPLLPRRFFPGKTVKVYGLFSVGVHCFISKSLSVLHQMYCSKW